jgi:hypothetical protein
MIGNPVVRRTVRALTHSLGRHKARQAAELLDRDGLLATPVERVGAPFAISIRRTGIGVELDHYDLVGALLVGLAKDFAEDPDGVGWQLQELAASSDGERDALLDQLLDRLGGATQRMGSTAAHRLADRIIAAAGSAIPNQQDRRVA